MQKQEQNEVYATKNGLEEYKQGRDDVVCFMHGNIIFYRP